FASSAYGALSRRRRICCPSSFASAPPTRIRLKRCRNRCGQLVRGGCTTATDADAEQCILTVAAVDRDTWKRRRKGSGRRSCWFVSDDEFI
ncbi:hypothetical protein PMAYCL1PPCAC_20743, partial [Pristionchus mayeri]